MYFQMMRLHSKAHGDRNKTQLKLLKSQQNPNSSRYNRRKGRQKLSEEDTIEELVKWANTTNVHQLYGSDKYILTSDVIIDGDSEKISEILGNGLYYIGLIESILPGIINSEHITTGDTKNDRLQNITLAVETAQRMGIPLFVSPTNLLQCTKSSIVEFFVSMYDGWQILNLI